MNRMDVKTVPKAMSSNAVFGIKAVKRKDQQSFSDVGLQPFLVKKRGVYVEKKILPPSNATGTNNVQRQKKAPQKPRLEHRKLFTSVLTILSKSTTGTQYPEIKDGNLINKTILRPQLKCSLRSQFKLTHNISRYTSRTMNDDKVRPKPKELVIVQSKKVIDLPSCTNSFVKSTSDTIDSNVLLNRNTIRNILEKAIHSGVAEGDRETFEGKQEIEEKKMSINDDPQTVAPRIAKTDDKNMCNFFVDLLETLGTYNAIADFCSDASKLAFTQMDDTVVKSAQRKKINFDITENTPTPAVKAKSCLISSTGRKKTTSRSMSFAENRKKCIRKANERDLLNMFKEQLEKDANKFIAPVRLYDALKAMAKNKRRNEKSTNVMDKINGKYNITGEYVECVFDQRNMISFKRNKKEQTTKDPSTNIWDGEI